MDTDTREEIKKLLLDLRADTAELALFDSDIAEARKYISDALITLDCGSTAIEAPITAAGNAIKRTLDKQRGNSPQLDLLSCILTDTMSLLN